MPIPPDIATLAASQDFWAGFLGSLRGAGRGLSSPPAAVEWALPEAFALKLEFRSASDTQLTFLSPAQSPFTLGSRHEAVQTHVLRFEEADLIGRWIALADVEWTHPGLLLALLQAYIPITTGEQADLTAGMFWQAWQSLGTPTVRQILASLERSDWRGADVRWQQTPALGWTLTHGHEVLRGRRLLSTRLASNSAFPFTALRHCEEALQRALHAAIDRAWIAPGAAIRDLATASMEDPDPARWPILADALEESGCPWPGMLAAFRPPVDPVRALVMLEVLLGPLGVVPGQLLPGRLPPPPRRETERLEIWLPLTTRYSTADAEEFLDMLRTDLFREDQGTVMRESLQFSELRLRVILRGDLEPALQTLYRACRRSQVPDGTRIACDSDERHSTVFWPDWFDLDFR